MNKTSSGAVVGVLLLLVGGIAWFEHRAAQDSDEALAALRQRDAALDARLARAREKIAVGGPDSSPAPAAAPAPVAAATAASPRKNFNFFAWLGANPRIFALQQQAFRANLKMYLGPFYQAQNLAPEQIERIETLITDHNAETMDTLIAANAQGLVGSPSVNAMLKEQEGQFTAAATALLGEAGMQQFQNYQRAGAVENMVQSVANDVAMSSTPLSGPQAAQLTQILANASSSYQSGGEASQATVNWGAALAQAQGILSPAQFNSLKSQYQQTLINQDVGQFRKAEFGGN